MSTSENFSINTSKIFSVKKGFATIAIISIVLLIVAVAGVIFFAKFKNLNSGQTAEDLLQTIFSSVPSAPPQKPLIACSESAMSSSGISSDWKQYTSRDFGYSIYYPSTWKFGVKEGSIVNALNLNSPDFHEDPGKAPDKGTLIRVFAERLKYTSLDDLYSQLVHHYTLLNQPVPFISACITQIGNNKALRIEQENKPSNILNFYFVRNGLIYYNVSLYQFNSDYMNTFNQILSTFKLLN